MIFIEIICGGFAGLAIAQSLQITDLLNKLIRRLSQLEADMVAFERTNIYSNVAQEAPPILKYRPPGNHGLLEWMLMYI